MSKIEDLRTQASVARKAKRLDEALPLYRELWTENRSACNEWDGWGYAYTLRKQGRFEDALNVCREVFRECRGFEPICNVYAWCIYDLHLKVEEVKDPQRFEKAANAIIGLCKRDDQYSPFVRTVFRVLDHLKVGGSSEKVREWTGKLDPSKLSTEAREFTDSRGKQVRVASDCEKWFSIQSKALEKTGRFSECREVCEQALSEISPLHHDNEIWFKRRIALAKAHAGARVDAVQDLKGLLCRRKEWFLCADIACLLAEMEDNEGVIDYAIEALLLPGDLEKKWQVPLLLAETYESAGDLEAARTHACLAAALREEQGWKSTKRLGDIFDRLEIERRSDETVEAIRKTLLSVWRSHKESKQPRKLGRVKSLLPNGKAGFVRADDGKEYYFPLRAFRGRKQDVVPKLRISFGVEESFDRKKNRPSLQAVEIRTVPENRNDPGPPGKDG